MSRSLPAAASTSLRAALSGMQQLVQPARGVNVASLDANPAATMSTAWRPVHCHVSAGAWAAAAAAWRPNVTSPCTQLNRSSMAKAAISCTTPSFSIRMYATGHESKWEAWRQALLQFVQQHGRLPVRSETPLGMWVQNQRKAYNAVIQHKPSSMTPERIRQLETVGGWMWDVLQAQWYANYQQLLQFVQQHERIPVRSETPLGDWMAKQRQAYKACMQGRPCSMTPERIRQLEAVPGWTWDAQEAAWHKNYQQLLQFVQQHERLPVRSETPLGMWAHTQRTAYKASLEGRPSSMTRVRIEQLEAVPGWTWDALEAAWREKHWHAWQHAVQTGSLPRHGSLGRWVRDNRSAARKFLCK